MFSFLLYIRPTWYYRLAYKSLAPILADYSLLSDAEKALIVYDTAYNTERATKMDAAFQGLTKGIIPKENQVLKGKAMEPITGVDDNYRFIRKYFATHWYVYAFILRILTLNNPFREIYYFIKHSRTAKLNLYQNSGDSAEELRRQTYSVRPEDCPLVSVIIPTLNRYTYLKDVLADLEKQDYPNFEVIVCDQSEPVDEEFYNDWQLDLHLIKQEEKALWLARNECIKISNGEWILLFDDDSRVDADWISRHMQCVRNYGVQISAGVTDTIVGHGLSPRETYFHLSDVFDTGNALVNKEVFRKVGLFDRQFEKQRMGDGEFGLRALLGGYQIVSNPLAQRIHLKVETGGLRQMGSWDALRPKKLLAPRPVPSVLYLFRKYHGEKAAMYYLIQNLPFSFIKYKHKKLGAAKLFSLLMLPYLTPIMFWVASNSWYRSSIKLKIGPMINRL